jgi:hypothetical protein
MSPGRQKRGCSPKWMLHFLGRTFWLEFQPECKFRTGERICPSNIQGSQVPRPGSSCGWAGPKRSPPRPGCLATSWPSQPGWALLSAASHPESAFGLNSLDRSWKPSYNSTSSTSDVPAGTAGQLLAITSPKGSACMGRSLYPHLGLGRNT